MDKGFARYAIVDRILATFLSNNVYVCYIVNSSSFDIGAVICQAVLGSNF